MGHLELYQALEVTNAHWTTGEVSGVIKRSPHRRRSFQPLRDRIEALPFEVLAGPRQVGKTTLLGHLMEDLLHAGRAPTEILYAPLDSPPIAVELGGHLEPLVQAYERHVARRRLRDLPRPALFFLDEVHTLPQWDRELKGLYDAYHPWLRVMATGSSSAALLNPPTADLPGRVNRSYLYPLKFRESLDLQSETTRALCVQAKATRPRWAEATADGPARDALASTLEELYVAAAPHLTGVHAALDTYLVRGGYPAAQPPAAADEAVRFFETTTALMVGTDLKLYGNVRKPGGFLSFLAKLGSNHGGKFVARPLAEELGTDKETPTLWKAIAEELFVVHQLHQLNASLNPILSKADKAYIQDPGMRAYLAAQPTIGTLETSGRIGEVAEGVLFDHLRRLQFNTFHHRSATIGYWSKPEVDFLVQLPLTWLAIEVKYRRQARPASHLDRLAAERDDLLPMVATRDGFTVEGPVWRVPLWMLLLIA